MGEEAETACCDCGSGGCGGSCGGGCEDCACVVGEDEEEGAAPRGWRWLESTVKLQREAYGFEWTGNESAGQVAESLKDNLLAAAVELTGEVPREFHWKYWSHAEPFVNRSAVLEELVDVLHFVANMLIAIGVTDDELEEAYQAKQAINRARHKVNYIAASGKEL